MKQPRKTSNESNRIAWRALVEHHTNDCRFEAAATDSQFSATESELGISLPQPLRELLMESNGIVGPIGVGLIWPLDEIAATNLAFRTNSSFRMLYMPFDAMLFFGDAGDGDQYAFRILNREIRQPDVFIWNHEDDSRTCFAWTLQQYVEKVLTGRE